MALLRTQIVRKVQNQAGSAIANANATIYSLPDNSLATVYTNETGTATYTQPLQSGLDGSFAGWLELGDYSITISSSAGTSTSRYYANHPQQSYLETYNNDVPLTVKAGTALTSNMAEWKDASGSTVMSVSTAGSITSPTVTAIQGSVTNTQGSVVAVNSSLGSALGTIGTNSAAIGSVSGTVTINTAAIGSVAGTVANLVTQPIGTVTGSYIFGTADAGKLLKSTSSTAIIITVPQNGSATIPTGSIVHIIQWGAGSVTVSPGSAVTLRGDGNKFTINAQYGIATLMKMDTNEWVMFGNVKA